MKPRKAIPKKIERLLQKEISNKCPIPYCDNTDVQIFEIHHIDNEPLNNDFENLLLLCPNCHSKIPDKGISNDFIKSIKIFLKNNLGNIGSKTQPSKTEKIYNLKNILNENGIIFAGDQKINELNINPRKVKKTIYQRSENDITEEQAKKIKDKFDEIVQTDVEAGKITLTERGDLYKKLHNTLNKKFNTTTYKAIPKEKFEEAYNFVCINSARNVSKLRRTNNDEWRKKRYRSIQARANQLGIDVHQFANEKLNLENPIFSLKELGEQN